jgi:YVTN family beta-propeller protein
MYSAEADSDPYTIWPVGVCYCPSNDKVYCVEASSLVYYYSWAVNTPKTVINTGVATANPRRIKYNSNDGLIYVPGWASNSVIVIDPATNTVQSEKTGFYLPWDVVFTPTKKWAVQNSSQGLREIT